MSKNFLRKFRESLMISKTELAKKANISTITIARIEQGKPCRTETKRKIILAFGLKISDKIKVFDD
jgi:DNA-binding XRE family transcriptional regulator